ncbi:alanine racemase [Jeotgalibacillus proteolyticus]|uniref:Alanine racemase n=1 Tax=Jeotgalibacillus proteolyticus TaxID=2082395 RepID=A0A2S5GDU6_9BACL|nr:alanine racemase [Jeotgalibacillus proteolyticus]PPA71128.1 alanine racemase [Jeotgalibacillus proteolyticus]
MGSRKEFYRDTWAEVNLDAIAHNIKHMAKITGQKTGIMAVVKANAYGHGYVQVAETALSNGATHLAVAFLDEALFLRRQGITAPIVVLGASRPQNAGLAAEENVQLTVFTKEWIQEAGNYLSDGQQIRIHIKCDTGMGRLGVKTTDELIRLENEIEKNSAIHIEGIYTHFATADEVNRKYADEQINRFKLFVDALKQKPELIHASNSAAAFMRKDSLFSIIRFGISMYGLSPSSEIADLLPVTLEPALSLYTTIVQVKKVSPGDKISYGATYEAKEHEWIATLPVGYADGWIRKMQGFKVLVDGNRVPIVGRVCMDQCMIRLPKEYPIGTKVTLFGGENGHVLPMDEVADHLETINYEVACAVSARVPRVYHKNNESFFVLNPLV